MKLWIGVEVYQLIVQDVHIFKSEEEALKWFDEYVTDEDYKKAYLHDDREEYPDESDFDETKIFEVEIDL